MRIAAMKNQIRTRHVRAGFHPKDEGTYQLPEAVRDRLTAALKPCRNRHAAFALATFIGRVHGNPAHVYEVFHVPRSSCATQRELGFSESMIRAAIMTLEDVGFLLRAQPSVMKTHPRKPLVLGAAYAKLFPEPAPQLQAARGRE